jgi:hypothetical protein
MPAADLAIAAVLLVGLGFVIRDTARRSGRWGINLRPLICPRCEAPLARTRVPTSGTEAMWGGSTCSCGCKLDKWGRERP